MMRLIAVIIGWTWLTVPVFAQSPVVSGFPPGTFQSRAAIDAASAPAYTGPGNVVSGALAWWGLRGYNAAFSGNVADYCDTATGLICATATWAGSTLTIPTISGSVCGSGISCVAKKLYDQTGNGFDVVQATLANMPAFSASCATINLPCLTFASGQGLRVASSPTQAQPATLSLVAQKTGGAVQTAININNGNIAFGPASSGSQWLIYAGGASTMTTAGSGSCVDNSWHAGQGVINSTSSIINCDGTEVANGASIGTLGFANNMAIGTDGAGENYVGTFAEAGVWAGGFTGTQRTNMCNNQFTYWGTSTSC